MKIFNYIYGILLAAILSFSGCGSSTNPGAENAAEPEKLLKLTIQQFETEKMKLGEVSNQHFESLVKCNAYITSPAGAMARVSTPVPGIVESVNCSLGNYVKKGQVLCRLSGNEFITLQQDFIESAAKLKRAKADYDRIKALYDEKIGAEKDFIAAESDYTILNAKYNSVKMRLQQLGLNTVSIGNGDIVPAFQLLAPINGFVTDMNLVIGQYIESMQTIIEIVDVSRLQLQLSVFETDISKLKPGQNVRFQSSGGSTLPYSAVLTSIGKSIDHESKTIECLANIKSESGMNLISGSFVEANIIVEQYDANALPDEAIVKSGDDHFVFVVERSDATAYYLRKVKVETGMISAGFTELKQSEQLTKVLVSGVYNLPMD